MRLLLLRHAKSDRPDDVADIDRPLAKRGRKASTRMGEYLAAEGMAPDLVLLSPSARTRETWDRVREAAGFKKDPKVRLEDGLYEAPSGRVIEIARAASKAKTVLVVGHNPGTQEAAVRLVGGGGNADLARLREGFPTAALAVIDFEGDASSIADRSGTLERFVVPRELQD